MQRIVLGLKNREVNIEIDDIQIKPYISSKTESGRESVREKERDNQRER